MAQDPINQHDVTVFPMNKLVPFLRAMADPTGNGELSAEEQAMIDRVESNLAREDEDDQR